MDDVKEDVALSIDEEFKNLKFETYNPKLVKRLNKFKKNIKEKSFVRDDLGF